VGIDHDDTSELGPDSQETQKTPTARHGRLRDVPSPWRHRMSTALAGLRSRLAVAGRRDERRHAGDEGDRDFPIMQEPTLSTITSAIRANRSRCARGNSRTTLRRSRGRSTGK
jgi:hypothetical protein